MDKNKPAPEELLDQPVWSFRDAVDVGASKWLKNREDVVDEDLIRHDLVFALMRGIQARQIKRLKKDRDFYGLDLDSPFARFMKWGSWVVVPVVVSLFLLSGMADFLFKEGADRLNVVALIFLPHLLSVVGGTIWIVWNVVHGNTTKSAKVKHSYAFFRAELFGMAEEQLDANSAANFLNINFGLGISKNNPEASEGIAEVSEGELEVSEGEPEVTKDEPEVTKDEPEVTKDEPEVSEDEPEVSEGGSSDWREPFFRRKGEFWIVKFAGKDFCLKIDRGSQDVYERIAFLLQHPHKEFACDQLVSKGLGEDAPFEAERPETEDDEYVTATRSPGVKNLPKKLLFSTMEELREKILCEKDIEEREKLEGQLRYLERYLNEGYTRAGKVRAPRGQNERATQALKKNRDRLVKKTARFSSEFSEHIRQHINFSGCSVVYRPPVPIQWDISY